MIPLMKNAFVNESETKKALSEFILSAPRLSMDAKCLEFEKSFASYMGVKDAILFNSGGSANLAIFQTLKNLGILQEGDNVGFSALTWSTNIMPIIQMGFNPVPVDCDPKTLNCMSYNLKDTLKNVKLKAFFKTNALGFAGDLDEIKKICQENDILFLEDNCEALGTELYSGKTGTFGEMSSFSFFVAHHMSTIEGGMVCTNNLEFGQMLRIVRANGWDRNLVAEEQYKLRKKYNIDSEFLAKYTFFDLGYNFRPTEITGFLGLYQLEFLENSIRKREANYKYLEHIMIDNPDFILLEYEHIKVLSNFAFPIVCKTKELRDFYLAQFSGAGIEIRPMIAGDITQQPFYKKYNLPNSDLPGVKQIHDCGFYCGNYPELTEIDLEILSGCLKKY